MGICGIYARCHILVRLLLFITLENHCNRTVQSLRAGCSRREHKIVYLAVKKGNIFVNIIVLETLLIIATYISSCIYA